MASKKIRTEEEKEAIRKAKSDRMKAINAKRAEERAAKRVENNRPPDPVTRPIFTSRASYRKENGLPTYDQDPYRRLSAFQERFVDEYIRLGNQTKAVIAAGYKTKHAKDIAYQLMHQPAILNAIRARREEATKDLTVSVERVMLELAKIAFADSKDFVEFDGNRIRIKPDAVVDGAVISEVSETSNDRGTTTKIKLHDKMAALKELRTYLGVGEKFEISGKMTLIDLLKGMEEEASKKE